MMRLILTVSFLVMLMSPAMAGEVRGIPGRNLEMSVRFFKGTYQTIPDTGDQTEDAKQVVVAAIHREGDRLTVFYTDDGNVFAFVIPMENDLVEKLDSDGFTRRETDVRVSRQEVVVRITRRNETLQAIESIHLKESSNGIEIERSVQRLRRHAGGNEWLPVESQRIGGLYDIFFAKSFKRLDAEPFAFETLKALAESQRRWKAEAKPFTESNIDWSPKRQIEFATGPRPAQEQAVTSPKVVDLASFRARRSGACDVLFDPKN